MGSSMSASGEATASSPRPFSRPENSCSCLGMVCICPTGHLDTATHASARQGSRAGVTFETQEADAAEGELSLKPAGQ